MNIAELFNLKGRVALVTGAGQGIGRAYALALADAGAGVAVVDINDATGRRTAEEIAARGGRSLYVNADVTKEEQVIEMVERTVAELGSLDVAVNNAWAGGRFVPPPTALEFPLEQWNFVLSLALTGVFVCCKSEAKEMIRRGRGKIINTASMSATIANASVAYCCAKAGVVMLTKRLAAEWGQFNINVNCISPSYTLSPARRRDSRDARDAIRAYHPMGWYERPADLCGTLIYLASDASNYVTGRDILVDGGHTLNIWLEPLKRHHPPLVSRDEEVESLIQDLDALNIPHDDQGMAL